MYTDLLVPIDGSKLSAKAFVQALPLAKALKARVVVLYATPMYKPEELIDGGARFYLSTTKAEYAAMAAREADRVLKPAADMAAAAEIECKTVHVVSDSPWRAIIAAAKAQKCDAIVMASHGRRGVSGLLLGSETQKVLTHSTIPVLVLR